MGFQIRAKQDKGLDNTSYDVCREEILRDKGGVMNGQLHLANVTFDLGDSVTSKTTLPKGTVRK